MIGRYECHISFPNYPMSIIVKGDDIRDFQEGFWVDIDFKLVKGDSCRYWIPPSAILYIEKSFSWRQLQELNERVNSDG